MSRMCSMVLEEVHRSIVALLRQIASLDRVSSLLDVGCWDGSTTLEYSRATGGARAFGIEVFVDPAAEAVQRGVSVATMDLERDRFPWADQTMDLVVCNQVFEHLKNVWLPMSEIARVLRVGGHLVFSVPNLASLHNRALLAVGVQPTSIRTFGPHVRGFTLGQTRAFLCEGGVFRIRWVSAAGFYPLPAEWARAVAAAFPGTAHTSILWVQKIEHRSEWPWAAYANVRGATKWADAGA
ncbi:MAG TPA: class I SAM-dependent methyltransferase [bacterium]